ncbi:glycosyltransferase family 9 protein [Dyella tabacisoli]|uniref:Lipopolysaccharide heptosyltransferase family protein n=1 Tax=Dyella tabacisoli TaxID=2282381 RepID=A0A369UQK1_9GAMM|nr:glycosyltransferase family 9 protein [Dyella tabacisoli]RDD82335.1 lipopolysaccharide heptosyltransferase family protein [Dyella tabacisoli]
MSISHSPVVIRFGRLGDILLLQPLLQELHRRYGMPCRLLAVGTWPAPLYAKQPEVGEVIALEAAHRPLLLSVQRCRAVLALRRMRDAPFYICEPEPRALAKIRRMLALAGVAQDHCVFITETSAMSEVHWVDRMLAFGMHTPKAFTAVAKPAAATVAAPRLQVCAAECADLDHWLDTHGLRGHPLVLLQPANKRTIRWSGVRHAADDDKSWPVERWAALTQAVLARRPDARVLLCGSPAEAAYLETIRIACGDPAVITVAGELPLGRLKALLSIAHSMISVDTGPAHIAAAVGCPLVVLFGSGSPLQWMPRSACQSAVSALGGPPLSRRVDAITLAQVIVAWQQLPPRALNIAEAVYQSAGTGVMDHSAG